MHKTLSSCLQSVFYLALLVRHAQTTYQDEHFTVKCIEPMLNNFHYTITLNALNTTTPVNEVDMDDDYSVQISYTYGIRWENMTCETMGEETFQWDCTILKGFRHYRHCKVRIMKSGHVRWETRKTFNINYHNYKCFKQHGFRSLSILSMGPDSIALSYEIYSDDILYHLDDDSPIQIEYFALSNPTLQMYSTDGIMMGSNHEILTNLQPCTEYQICLRIQWNVMIGRDSGKKHCLQSKTYCTNQPKPKHNNNNNKLIYGMATILFAACIFIGILLKKLHSQKTLISNKQHRNKVEHEPLQTIPPPLPKRPKHLQTQRQRFVSIISSSRKAMKPKRTKKSSKKQIKKPREHMETMEDTCDSQASCSTTSSIHFYTSIVEISQIKDIDNVVDLDEQSRHMIPECEKYSDDDDDDDDDMNNDSEIIYDDDLIVEYNDDDNDDDDDDDDDDYDSD